MEQSSRFYTNNFLPSRQMQSQEKHKVKVEIRRKGKGERVGALFSRQCRPQSRHHTKQQ